MATTDPRPVMDPESALGFLAQASGVLAGSLDYERTLEEVARLVVPDIADWCAVDILEADGSMREITSVHPQPEQEALLLELRRRYREQHGGSAGATYAIVSGKATLRTDVTDEIDIELRPEEEEAYRRLRPRSYIIVPLVARGRTIGALTLLSTREGRHYTDSDLDFARHLSRRFALAIDNARLYDEAESSRAMLDTLFQAVPVGIAFLDSSLHCVRMNEALTELGGTSELECTGRPIAEMLGPIGAGVEPLARDVLATGAPIIDRELSADGSHWIVSVTPVLAADGAVAGLGLVTIDVTERRKLLDRTRFLAEAGALLESSLDPPTVLRNIARMSVPELADWCAVNLVADNGELELVAAAHPDPEREALAWDLQRRFPPTGEELSGPMNVVRTGALEIMPDITDEMLVAGARDDDHLELLRGLQIRSSVVAPLKARGRTLGTLTLVMAESGRKFGAAEIELIEEVARRTGLAVENARLYTERTRIAHTLQAELLPTLLPDIPGAAVAVRYRAAGELNEVGGDFYDVFENRQGDYVLVIGDVSGKGAEAAAVTALARHTVRTASLALQPAMPTELLMTLNESLMSQRNGNEFCTVCIGRLLRTDTGATLRLSLGGHPPALVLRADGTVEQHGEPGTLIGIFPDPELTNVEVELRSGDLVLLYTDGVTEAGPVGAEIGEDGLAELLPPLAGMSAEQVVDAVEQAAVDIQGGQPRDDIALVALRLE